jgi:CRP/FNR family cyclic AMP-dependent transcriptional regulator
MLGKKYLQLPRGENIFVQDEVANSIYFIDSGRVLITIADNWKTRTIAQLSSGDFFGEHCLAFYPYRPNTATTLENTVLIEYDKDDIQNALGTEQELCESMIRNLIAHNIRLERLLFEILNV